MTDFKIRRGRYDQLFDENGDLRRKNIVLELGCWYLCTDEAWLFLCVENSDGSLDLKQINQPTGVNRPTTSPDIGDGSGDQLVNSIIYAEINENGELVVYYADSTSEVLGTVIGKDGKDGKDGLVTSVKIGKTFYEHTDGVITLPEFATTEFVEAAVNNIVIPEVNLENYYTKSETSSAITTAVAKKANTIPFSVDRYVTKPFGSFSEGDNVNGLTITEFLTRLLGLTEGIEEPVEDIVTKILANELSIYQADSTGLLSKVIFTYNQLTETDAAQKPTQAGFYQIIDDQGQVLESGYHQFTTDNPDYPYMIALPEEIDFYTQIRVQKYDDGLLQEWVPETLNLETDPDVLQTFFSEVFGVDAPKAPAGHRLWVALEKANDTSIYRLTIIV